MPLIIGSTGHRPQHLGGYGSWDVNRLTGVYVQALRFYGATRAVCRLAQGSDQAFANACLELGIPYDAIVPFTAEPDRWPRDAQRAYIYLLGRAAGVSICSSNATTANSSYQEANMRVVDRCDLLFALWSGAPGGTANTVRYAGRHPMVNLWKEWAR